MMLMLIIIYIDLLCPCSPLNLLPAGSWCFNAPLLTEMYLLIAETRSQPVKKIGWRGGKKTECSIMSRVRYWAVEFIRHSTKPYIASAGAGGRHGAISLLSPATRSRFSRYKSFYMLMRNSPVLCFQFPTDLVAFYSHFCQNVDNNKVTNSSSSTSSWLLKSWDPQSASTLIPLIEISSKSKYQGMCHKNA